MCHLLDLINFQKVLYNDLSVIIQSGHELQQFLAKDSLHMPYENKTHCEECYYSDQCPKVNFYGCRDYVPYHGTSFLTDREATIDTAPTVDEPVFVL